jgi:hypothetical protein
MGIPVTLSSLVVGFFLVENQLEHIQHNALGVPLELDADILGNDDGCQIETLFDAAPLMLSDLSRLLFHKNANHRSHVSLHELASFLVGFEVLIRPIQGLYRIFPDHWGKETQTTVSQYYDALCYEEEQGLKHVDHLQGSDGAVPRVDIERWLRAGCCFFYSSGWYRFYEKEFCG